jgi:hypothetical protein
MVQGIYFNHNCILEISWDSKVGVATSYGLGSLGLGPQWGGILHIVLISPGADPSYCTLGTLGFTHPTVQWALGLFLRVKQLQCGVEHTPPSSADGEEKVGCYLYSPPGPSWHVTG